MDVVDNMKTLFGNLGLDWISNSVSFKNDKNESNVGDQTQEKLIEDTQCSKEDINNVEQQNENTLAIITNKGKSLTNLLYTTVSEASAKIIKTLEENTLLGELNKEQEAFLKTLHAIKRDAVPPWVGYANEKSLKEECLRLSTDKRNFLRSPPTSMSFNFNYDTAHPFAIAIMEQDSNLERMRFELVPRVINENNFWRNYFYRLSLICQANNVTCKFFQEEATPDFLTTNVEMMTTLTEFVSDTLHEMPQDLAEVQEVLQKLSLGPKLQEQHWETQLEVELESYKDPKDKLFNTNAEENLDQEIEDLLKEGPKEI